jgi:copper transport protein
MIRRTTKRLLVGFVASVTIAIVPATAALAHSKLEESEPAAGAQLAQSPPQVLLRFNEPVEISLGAIRVFDHNGHQIKTSTAHHPGGIGSQVAVDLPKLADGGYVVAWRVVSADSHPVHEAFTFTVGTGGVAVAPGLVQNLLASEGGNTTVGALLAITRFLVYAGMAIALGACAFWLLCWPAGRDDATLVRVAVVAAVIATIASLVMIGLQGPYATGQGLSEAFKPSTWRSVVDTRSGQWWLIRSLALAVLAALAAARRATPSVWRVVFVADAAALLVAVAYGGHGGNGRYRGLGVVATVAHVGAMSVWIGGLIALLLILRRQDAGTIARRFSTVAFASVGVLVASGVAQGWRQVGSLDALKHTTYGHLLIIKVGLVAAVLAIAYFSRRSLQAQGDVERRGLRAKVAGETGIAVAVLVVTALLVNAVPAIAQRSGPFSATVLAGNRSASLAIEPAHVGSNVLHIILFGTTGVLDPAAEITAQITLPSRDVGPLPLKLTPAGPNHAIGNGIDIPFAGKWTLDVAARFGEFEEVHFVTTVDVR